MTLLDGRPLAAAIREQAAADAAAGPAPQLAALVATDDPTAGWYLRSLGRAATATGIALREERAGAGDGAAAAIARELERADAVVARVRERTAG